eukprot:11470417-Alexandrium_andersonii.AAC.1
MSPCSFGGAFLVHVFKNIVRGCARLRLSSRGNAVVLCLFLAVVRKSARDMLRGAWHGNAHAAGAAFIR